jgi:hypothetical protein
MLAYPSVTNSLYRNRIQVVPTLAAFASNDYQFCPDQNLQVFHHSGPAMRLFESGNDFGSCQWAVGQAIKNLPPRIVSESLPNLLGLGNFILLWHVTIW